MKDRSGYNSGEADDRVDDIQDDRSSGSSYEELQKDGVLVLCEDDIPGSSLNRSDPNQINIPQLKDGCKPWCSSFW